MRVNNLTARLKVNELLAKNGHNPLPSCLDYTEFATLLRKITAPTVTKEGICFVSRQDAVAYIRLVASGGVRIPEIM
jgi:hypothetical protein